MIHTTYNSSSMFRRRLHSRNKHDSSICIHRHDHTGREVQPKEHVFFAADDEWEWIDHTLAEYSKPGSGVEWIFVAGHYPGKVL